MSKATINYIGGIEDEKKGSNLTGSQTIFGLDIGKTRNPKVVVDAGAVQGVKKAEELNRQIRRDVLDADFLVITHAHADHAGMVPYLYKKGYSGRIIMTELTKLQCKAMWEDYVRLKQNEIEETKELNAKMASKLKNAFVIKELYEKVIQPDTYVAKLKEEIAQIKKKNSEIKRLYTKHLTIKTAFEKLEELKKIKTKGLPKDELERLNADKERVSGALVKIIKKQDPKTAYLESTQILNEQSIETHTDIEKLLKEVPKIEKNQKNKSDAMARIFDITGSENYETEYAIASARLKEFGIEYEKDISAALREIPVLLFNNDDIERVYEKIEILELGEELELQNYHPVSVGDDKSVLKLVEGVQSGNSKPIPVASYLKGTVTAKLKNLIKKTAKEIEENAKKEEVNTQLKKDLKLAFEYARWYEEQTGDLENFQKKYGKYLEIDTDEVGDEIERLGNITLSTQTYKTQELLEKFLALGMQIPTIEEYMELSWQFDEELGIKNIEDINKHLPELSENAYSTMDVRGVLKNAIFSSNTRSWEHIQYSTDIFDVYKIIEAYKNGKKVFFPQKLKAQLISAIEALIGENQWNLERNNDFTRELSEAFDIVEMYEGNTELYKQSKFKEYQKAKKFLKNHKFTKPVASIYNQEDIDYILDIEYNSIQKSKKIIHIKKLNDSRIYDILTNKDFNTVYYFEPNIRERVKEKLKERVRQMHLDNLLTQDSNRLYQEYSEFVKRYETSDEHDISAETYHQAKSKLRKHNITQRQEISEMKVFETNFHFSKKDLEELVANITFMPEGASIDDITSIVITDIEDERIFDLPSLYQDKTKVIIIDEDLKAQVKEKLIKGIADFYRTSLIRKSKRKELSEKFQRYQTMKQNSHILFNIEGFSSGQELYDFLLAQNAKIRELRELLGKHSHAKKLFERISSGGEAKEDEYQKAISLLETYNITNIDQITDVGEAIKEVKYSIKAIERTIALLKSIHIDKNAEILESLKLNFFDAGHIEGSVQAVLTAVVSEVDNILSAGNQKPAHYGQKRRHKHVNFGLSGDLGRIKDPNLAGTPDIIPFKLDYYQMEATYADRIHLDKQECINNFFNSVDSASGKIIVPAFSMQRTQELLMIVLQKMLGGQKFKQEIGELKKQREIYLGEFKKISPKATDRDILDRKEFLDEEINTLTLRIDRYEALIFDIDIILDSPLSEKITDIYIDKCGEKYNLLDPKVQRELFGREVITYVKKSLPGEGSDEGKTTITLEDLYSLERRDKKEIVFSASGMGDGGAIVPHLKENLPNQLSKIIKVGYAPLSTRLGKIHAGDEFISINGEPIELKCEVDDIPGFSGHIDEEEMIMLLTQMEFKKGAIIALTHGDEKRYLLAERIQEAMDAIGKKVKVIVPKLGDTTPIKL